MWGWWSQYHLELLTLTWSVETLQINQRTKLLLRSWQFHKTDDWVATLQLHTHTHTSFLNLFLVTLSSYFVSPAFVSLCVRVLLHLLTLVCCQVLSFSSQQTFFYHFLLNTNCHTKIWNILIIIIIIIKQSQYLMTSFHTCCWLC